MKISTVYDSIMNAIGWFIIGAVLFSLLVMVFGCASNPRRPESVDQYPGVVLIHKKF